MTRGRGLVLLLGVVVLGLALGGCGKASGSVEGDWVLDTEATRANVRPALEQKIKEQMGDKAAKAAAALEPMVTKAVDGMMRGMDMTASFKDDGTCTLNANFGGDANLASGTWTKSGNTITLEIVDDKDKKKETIVMRIESGKLLMDIGQEGSAEGTPNIDIVLKRK